MATDGDRVALRVVAPANRRDVRRPVPPDRRDPRESTTALEELQLGVGEHAHSASPPFRVYGIVFVSSTSIPTGTPSEDACGVTTRS